MTQTRFSRVAAPAVLARAALALVLGSVLTVGVAWVCAAWSIQRSPIIAGAGYGWHQMPAEEALAQLRRAGYVQLAGPDGPGLYRRMVAIGYEHLTWAGEAQRADRRLDVFWRNPYTGYRSYHSAGWPWPALRSVVTPLDYGRDIMFIRTRWELPPMEIFSRGLCTHDLPAWLHAQPNRRLPLLIAPGFAADALLYALPVHALLCWRGRTSRAEAARQHSSAP